jgi:hypothetical protein
MGIRIKDINLSICQSFKEGNNITLGNAMSNNYSNAVWEIHDNKK